MKQEFGYNDEKLNQFKLMIYDWNINNAIEHYENDSFCYNYCISARWKYGCRKQENECPFEHLQAMNLTNLIVGGSQHVQQDYKTAKLLCLYLMDKKVCNNNSELFMHYGDILYKEGTKMQDYLKCEQYYLKSLNIDNNNETSHASYAFLLENKLNNFDKAEYHYKKSFEIDPNNANGNWNFARFLKDKQKKYSQSLIYINKACELRPNKSLFRKLKGQVLYELNKFEESIDETIHALKLNENDGYMNKRDNVNRAKNLIEKAIEKFITQELKTKYYFKMQSFTGYELIEWLYDNQLLSIKREIFTNEISMEMLSKCDDKDLDELLKEMKLKTTTKIKFQEAVNHLRQQQQAKQEQKDQNEPNESTRNDEQLLIQQQEETFESKMDTMSVYSGVSAVPMPYVINAALIVFLGIGDYNDALQNLPGVFRDYQNILNTFVETWKYTVFYKTDKNFSIYTNNINIIKSNNNYKLHWTIDEIEKFVEEARMYVTFNKHNGLIFVISSHGDTGKVIYDSNMDEYELPAIFNMFQPQWGELLETYNEPPEISKRLFQIPKIFCIDSCRGSTCAKIVNVNSDQNDDNEQKSKKSQQDEDDNDKEKLASKSKTTKERERFASKSVSKEMAKVLSTNYSNFCKIWANVEGYSVADGSLNGGLFLRNVTKLFQDKKWILNHSLNDIILKIRDYTKREATLIGVLNFTQLVENEATMERPVRFDVFEENVIYKTGQEFLDKVEAIGNETEEEEDDGLDRVRITNLSSTDKIAVFVENEQNNEDRKILLQSLIDDNNSNDKLFTSKGYQLISPATKSGIESVKFIKTWDYTFVTVINITEKELICDRKRYFEDYLYFDDDALVPLLQYKPKCDNKNGKKHTLKEILISSIDVDNENEKFECDKCQSIKSNVYFHCYKCKYSLCQNCCHRKICSRK